MIQGNTQYLVDAAKAIGLISSNFNNVNRGAAANWPFVITEPSRSSAPGSGVKVPHNSGGGGGGPPPSSMSQPVSMSQPPVSNMNQSRMQQPPQQQQAPMAAQPPRQQQAPQASGTRAARALYPFQGQDNTEISFQPGQVVNVIQQSGDWWVGEINGQRGYFPASYVQLI